MRKIIVLVFLFIFLPAASHAEEDVIVERRNCYAALLRIFCKGTLKNTSGSDIENVIVRFTSSYLKLHAPKIDTDAFDQIERIPAGGVADFVVVWDASAFDDLIDPDILREYILTSINNGTMEIIIMTGDSSRR